MIPFNFIYHRPESLAEAVGAYAQAERAGLKPLYLSGGTEIVSFCRIGRIQPGAVVDIKRLTEARALGEDGSDLVFGAALTLNEIIASGAFPLLGASARIVDHTVRNRLTLGGNIAGMLPYRETVLPLLLAGARARLAGPSGERVVPLAEVFEKRLLLGPGELLVQIRVPKAEAALPWFHRRQTRQTRLDYPLLTVCLLRTEGGLRMAVTGAFGFPLRSSAADEALNDTGAPPGKRAEKAYAAIARPFIEDMRGSAEYRRMLFERALAGAIEAMGGER